MSEYNRGRSFEAAKKDWSEMGYWDRFIRTMFAHVKPNIAGMVPKYQSLYKLGNPDKGAFVV